MRGDAGRGASGSDEPASFVSVAVAVAVAVPFVTLDECVADPSARHLPAGVARNPATPAHRGRVRRDPADAEGAA